MNYAFLTLILLVCSSQYIIGGNWWGKPQKVEQKTSRVDPLEPIKKELTTYLENLDIQSIKTRSQLERYLQNTLNRDIHNETKFPNFIALTKQQGFDDPSNLSLQTELGATIETMVIAFVEKKSAELEK